MFLLIDFKRYQKRIYYETAPGSNWLNKTNRPNWTFNVLKIKEFLKWLTNYQPLEFVEQNPFRETYSRVDSQYIPPFHGAQNSFEFLIIIRS
jgi:hypothetical protein